MAVSEPVEVFYAYAKEDEGLRRELEKHLSALRRQGYISEWHEEMVEAGAVQEQEVNRHLMSARIILLLTSSDFVDSDYCYGVEVQAAMRRQRVGEAVVIPILLRPCDWKNTPFGPLQALPRDGRAVTLWKNQDEVFLQITQELRKTIERLNETSVTRSRSRQTGSGSNEATIQGGKQSQVGKRIGEGSMEYRNTLMGIKRKTVSTSTGGGVQKALLA